MSKITQEEKNNYFADWILGKIPEETYKELLSKEEFLVSKKLNKTLDVIKELNAPMDEMLAAIKSNGKNKKTKVMPLFVKWSGAIAAVFLLLFSLNTFLKKTDIIEFTNIGEQKTIALLDNSEVILNANSKITYNTKSWKNKRELFLDGEAYFKVTKKGNTFTVNTKNGNVTVLGTHFNVKTTDTYFLVSCYEGKVRVIDKDNKETILTAGKSVVYNNKTAINKMLTINQPTWLLGKISFDNTPLSVVLDELENQFDITIDRNKVDINQNYTGTFTNKDLRLSLKMVLKPMQISFTMKDKRVTLKP